MAKQKKSTIARKSASKSARPATPIKTPVPTKPRRLKKAKYRSFRLQKRIRHTAPKLPSALKLFRQSISLILSNKKYFIKFALLYGLITLFVVRGVGSGLNIAQIKGLLQDGLKGDFNNYSTSLSLFGFLIGNVTNVASEVAGVYQALAVLLTSLATIWMLRQIRAGITVTVRDSYYKGMYPLVPFVAVFFAIGLQLVPLLIGNFLYKQASSADLIVSGVERAVWVIFVALTALLSFYMVTSSIFALYIVTLPDMTPMKSLKAARKLVQFRRFTVMRKVIILPLFMIVLSGIFTVPVLLYATALAEPLFFVLTVLALPLFHTYMYLLYRELLNE